MTVMSIPMFHRFHKEQNYVDNFLKPVKNLLKQEEASPIQCLNFQQFPTDGENVKTDREKSVYN